MYIPLALMTWRQSNTTITITMLSATAELIKATAEPKGSVVVGLPVNISDEAFSMGNCIMFCLSLYHRNSDRL